MDDDDRDDVFPSVEEVAAQEEAHRKKFIEDGAPLKQVPDGQIKNDDQSTGIVSEDEKTGLIDPLEGE
ncbi:hypothetical protein [Methylobacterium radiotolerans]|uniref:hypothetical protein n=1 Tax=Methylobacterium radiotolerans TaxID=31998 RepID=UPI001F2BA1A9|nr:hypothetical protein [Methylobacterium radiotolerans]UIY45586.1 hypothetical protein LZ599_31295 [Methylobacterium radiotolerans]